MMLESKKDDKKGSTTEDSWSMSEDFIWRHHEEPRLKLYDPEINHFRSSWKYAEVMRQSQTSINNVSEHIINELWTEVKEGPHSFWGVDWGFKILDLTNKISWRIQVGKCTTYKDPKYYQTRQCCLKLGHSYQKTHGQINWIDRWQRLFQGDCWRSSETGKGYCSCLAVHFKGGQPRIFCFAQLSLMPARDSQIQKTKEYAEK